MDTGIKWNELQNFPPYHLINFRYAVSHILYSNYFCQKLEKENPGWAFDQYFISILKMFAGAFRLFTSPKN